MSDMNIAPKQCLINRYASQLYRSSISFYDRCLKKYGLSAGMQFFLLRIYERPGITTLELAEAGRFDRGTTARAVKKLHKQGYVELRPNEQDGRSHLLYLTEAVREALNASYQAVGDWEEIITRGLTPGEIRLCEELMKRVADNAFVYIKKQGGYR